jgi:poly-beta-hydroxyalkanoate depolymerase
VTRRYAKPEFGLKTTVIDGRQHPGHRAHRLGAPFRPRHRLRPRPQGQPPAASRNS